MKDGFIKVAAATPDIKVADCEYNSDKIIGITRECREKGVKLLVLPELCITGYTCSDLFFQDILLLFVCIGLLHLQHFQGIKVLHLI